MREKKIKRADIRRELMAITMAAAAAGTVTAASAATDIFIKIGDIKGESVDLKVNTGGAATFQIQIYRTGYYGGDGARLFSTIRGVTGVAQPSCTGPDGTTGTTPPTGPPVSRVPADRTQTSIHRTQPLNPSVFPALPRGLCHDANSRSRAAAVMANTAGCLTRRSAVMA